MRISGLAGQLATFIDEVEPRLTGGGEEWWSEPYAAGKWRRR